ERVRALDADARIPADDREDMVARVVGEVDPTVVAYLTEYHEVRLLELGRFRQRVPVLRRLNERLAAMLERRMVNLDALEIIAHEPPDGPPERYLRWLWQRELRLGWLAEDDTRLDEKLIQHHALHDAWFATVDLPPSLAAEHAALADLFGWNDPTRTPEQRAL